MHVTFNAARGEKIERFARALMREIEFAEEVQKRKENKDSDGYLWHGGYASGLKKALMMLEYEFGKKTGEDEAT